jgi:chromosome segregation ATPase
MTKEEIEARLVELDSKIARATGWGAPLNVLSKEREHLKLALARLDHQLDEELAAFGGGECGHDLDVLLAEIDQLTEERDEARRLQGKLCAEVGQLAKERDEARRLQGKLRAEIGQLTTERDEARRLHGKLALDASAAVADLERALGELRHAFRDSMLRHVPNITHEEIDRVLASCAVLKSEEGPLEGSLTTPALSALARPPATS